MRARTLSDYHRFTCTRPRTKKVRTLTMFTVYLLAGFCLGIACNTKYQTYTTQTLLNYSKTNVNLPSNLQGSVANNQTEMVNFC